MREQLRRAGTPGPKVVGIDEISIRKRHTYRIVVSDLVRGRPIWFGGKDRSEVSMNEFFEWLGPRKSRGIRMAVMDMWKPFRTSTQAHAPQARILFDKFHVLRHLGEALDTVRKSEYARLTGKAGGACASGRIGPTRHPPGTGERACRGAIRVGERMRWASPSMLLTGKLRLYHLRSLVGSGRATHLGGAAVVVEIHRSWRWRAASGAPAETLSVSVEEGRRRRHLLLHYPPGRRAGAARSLLEALPAPYLASA